MSNILEDEDDDDCDCETCDGECEIICPKCDGTGSFAGVNAHSRKTEPEEYECERCEGTGYIECPECSE